MILLHADGNNNKIFDRDGESNEDVSLIGNNLKISKQFSIMVIGKSWIIAEDQPLVNNTLKVINLNLDKLEQGLLKNETVWLVAHDEYDGI